MGNHTKFPLYTLNFERPSCAAGRLFSNTGGSLPLISGKNGAAQMPSG